MALNPPTPPHRRGSDGGNSATPDWEALRREAARFPDGAFVFVQEGLAHTVRSVHGPGAMDAQTLDEDGGQTAGPSRHVTGRDLCMGIREMAMERYGQLAPTVLGRWGIRKTEDFGTLVYAMIDRGDMRCNEDDTLVDFKNVYAFDDAFGVPAVTIPAAAKPAAATGGTAAPC